MSEKNSCHISCDVETNGPIIGKHSMISFGFVIVEDGFKRTFYGKLKPISEEYVPEALAVSGFTFKQTKEFEKPAIVMQNALEWIKQNVKGKPILWSDNNGYDAPWMNWYFLTYCGINPFGWSSRRIADFICGFEKDPRFKWKHLRRTKHTHHPVADAMGNAEPLLDYLKACEQESKNRKNKK